MKSLNTLARDALARFLLQCMNAAADELAQRALRNSVHAQQLRERVEAARPPARR